MNNIEAIKQDLCELGNNDWVGIPATAGEIRRAIASLDLDDREFDLKRDERNGKIIVTCHYKALSHEMGAFGLALAAIAIVLLMVLLSFMDDGKEQERERAYYCENVQTWIDSKGENGHPNYKGIECL